FFEDDAFAGVSTLGVTAAGGDIYDAPGATTTISNSEFGGDAIAEGAGGAALGGAIYQGDGTLTVTGSRVDGTFIQDAGVFGWGLAEGGALYVGGGNVSIVKTTIANSGAVSGTALGGGIYQAAGNLSMTNSTISHANVQTLPGGGAAGGGLYLAGGS